MAVHRRDVLAAREVSEPVHLDRGDHQLRRTLAAAVRGVDRQTHVLVFMFWCGEDKIIYGSEALIWLPKWALDAFWVFEIPQHLLEGYGYPQPTDQAKGKIPGENLLRVSVMDVGETRRRLSGAA
jgi:predicted TIM-barrel fold metal-dependent hydrolase